MGNIPTGPGRRVMPGSATPLATGEAIGAATGRSLMQLGQNIGDIGFQQQREQGQERVRLKQLADDADKARGLAAMGNAKVRLRDSVRPLTERILSGEVDGIAALGEWDSVRSEVTAQATQGLPAQIAEHVKSHIDADAGEIASVAIGRAAETRRRETTRADLAQALDGYERDALTDRPKALTMAQEAVTKLGATAGLGPDDQQRQLQRFRETTASNMAHQRLIASSRNPRALDAFQQQLQGDEFGDLSPDVRERFVQRIDNQRANLQHAQEVADRRAEAARARRLNEAEHAVRAVETIVDGGGIADDATLARAQQASAGTPWADALKTTVQQAAGRAAFGSLAPAQQEQALIEIRARLNRDGANPHQMRQLQQFESIRNRTRELVDRDPLEWGVNSRLLDGVEPLRIGSVSELIQSIDARVSQAKTVGAALRQPVSPLLASEAQTVGDLLAPLPASQKATALEALASRMEPAQAQAMARQISPKDKAMSLALAAGSAETTFDRLTAELILRGQAAVAAKVVKLDDAAETGLTARIEQELGGAIGNPKQAEMYRESAKLIYYGKHAERDQISAEQATRLALRGSVVSHNGSNVVVPAGMDEDELSRRLSRYPAEVLAPQLPDGKVYVRDQVMDAAQFLQALPAAKLRNVDRRRYVVLSGGAVVTNARKEPIVVDSSLSPVGGR